MITSIHIKQSSHFIAQLRFGGTSAQNPIELEHRPRHDVPKIWTVTSTQSRPGSVICEVEVWTVFGERTAFRFTSNVDAVSATQPFLQIHADEFGLTISGVASHTSRPNFST
jgi:hypothetical protein